MLFKRSLINSKFVFTEGGGFNAPVRKFFEITASGCLMFCREPNSFSDIGYKKNKHFIDVNSYDILEKMNYYLNNLDEAQTLAQNGYSVTLKNHSLLSRSNQLKNCLKLIKNGKFNGSNWKNGSYIVNKK